MNLRNTVFHPRGHAAGILHRATIIDARSSGTREHSAHVRVSAEVHITYYSGICIADEGLSKNPGEEKPTAGGSLAENHENRGEPPEKHRDFESGPSSVRTSLAGLKRASSNISYSLRTCVCFGDTENRVASGEPTHELLFSASFRVLSVSGHHGRQETS